MAKKTGSPRGGLNTAEQRFCEAYVTNGNNGAEAVATAWPHTCKWKPQTRAEKGSKLLALDKITARVSELAEIMRQKANAEFAMTAEEVLFRLALIARANLRNYMEIDANGAPTIAFKAADEGQFYALNEVSVEDIVSGQRQGKRTKVKLPDRISALKLLGQQHGMFKTDVRLNDGLPIPVVLSSAESAL